ncbi:SelB C-terminal domain-containing protein [Photobacterium profundum]|uniref:SelB domain-containing protein n=1 Tax=Photobacterium profundum TaxID=74109 RepID=UPI003D10F2BB
MIHTKNVVPTYQAVIGLAGHVDHGKTALIEALTGIVTARPHEQVLGMTQDLGFAHFQDDHGNTIGVIDVPGHERYLRNMVAGVWHLNALILVVAADEGWMPMTTSHVQVAHAMGVEEIILCINKRDKVSPERLSEVEEQALESVMEMTDLVPELISVSALQQDNISALRRLVIETVTRTCKIPMPSEPESDSSTDRNSPLLYVDRAFVVNGIGTVVTGTLAQGCLRIGDKVRCYPQGKVGTVRSIQAYHQQLDSVSGTCRVAVNVKGLTRKDVGRGHLLTDCESAIPLTEHCIVRISQTKTILPVRRQREVEVAIGTWHGVAKLCYIPNTQLARLVFKQPLPLQFAQRVAIILKGGSRLLHGGEVVWCDFIPSGRKRQIYDELDQLPAVLNPELKFQILLNLQGYFDTSKIGNIKEYQGRYLAPFMFQPEWLVDIEHTLLTILAEKGAMGIGEIGSRLRLDEAVLSVIVQAIKQQDKVHLSQGKWCLGQGDNEDDLPAEMLALLEQIRELGKAGLELSKVSVAGGKKWLRQLAHYKYITALDETIYYDMALYQGIVQAVIADHQALERITMSDIKMRAGLSRKYAIPLANRMEKDGWVRRDGDERIILRAWQSVPV